MGEEISRLMDGELDDAEVDAALRAAEASRRQLPTWVCYHVIGDALRGSGGADAGLCRSASRRGSRPSRRCSRRSRVRPTALPLRLGRRGDGRRGRGRRLGRGEHAAIRRRTAVAKAREAAVVRAARSAPVSPDYLLAHQEYSPTTQIQGVGPYLRPAVAGAGPMAGRSRAFVRTEAAQRSNGASGIERRDARRWIARAAVAGTGGCSSRPRRRSPRMPPRGSRARPRPRGS